MVASDIHWYRRLIKEVSNDAEMFMCSTCICLFRKLIMFIEQCHKAQIFLKQVYSQELQILPPPIGNNLTVSPTRTFYLGPEHLQEIDPDVKAEDSVFDGNEAYITEDEDDVPLVLFCGSNGDGESQQILKKEVLDDKVDVGPVTLEMQLETGSPVSSHPKARSKQKKQMVLREGFTSRMVQETAEYIVIKLTKEQVLEEMRERAKSNKYSRAPYKCERCVKGFNFEDVLQSHMDKHSPKSGPLQCELCGQRCPTPVSLRGHMKSHTTRYKCKLCGYIRHSRQHVLEHYTISHADSSAAYSCETCPFTSNKRTVMQRHVRFHGRTERHTCHKCGKLYKTLDSLRVHTMRHDAKKRFQCDQCTQSFIYPTLLQKHVQSVHVRRDYYCVECDIKFKSMDTLKLHFKRAKRHREVKGEERLASKASAPMARPKAHVCVACARSYGSRSALRAHARRRHADPG
ncbi:unnamed protein product, partial [Iphiclides podalirius]